jgi:uncharacterized membrane protein YjfL (UPF0719 family)
MSSSPTEAVAPARDRPELARRAARASRAIGVAVLLATAWVRARDSAQPGAGVWMNVWMLVDFGAACALWVAGCAIQHRALLGGRLRSLAPRGNEAAVLADSSHHLALALILSRALAGARAAELVPALVFAVVGVVTWALFVAAFRALTAYSDAEEIAGENAAAALSYAGVGLALAIVIAHAVDGPFISWRRSFTAYAAAVAAGAALYPVRQLVVQSLLLGWRPRFRARELDRAIGQERRLDVAAIEASAYLATALLLAGLA